MSSEKKPGDITFSKQHPLRILIAEDNVINQKLMMKVLAKLGYAPDVVENGQQALEALAESHHDIVLMDVQMPEMDGLEATRRIRVLNGRQPRIIAMTSSAMEIDRAACLEAGMDDHLAKPVHVGEFISLIQKWFPLSGT